MRFLAFMIDRNTTEHHFPVTASSDSMQITVDERDSQNFVLIGS